ncbi:Uncharacterised protein [[Ruminococcus] torques]|jgi:hypothetical protein|nr:Uncharacterised protein [[Ruminococcus] torques]DAI90778.1 MAG TPA: hypothetical protein [Bacteriophage sp.]
MIDIVKVAIPMETLMELLRKEAELKVLKEHISAEIESESSNYIDKKKIAIICSIPFDKENEGGVF